MNHGPHDICRSCETVEHCSSAGCIPLTTPSGAKACSMNPDSLPSFDEWLTKAKDLCQRWANAAHGGAAIESYREVKKAALAHLAAHPAAPQGAQPAEPVAKVVSWTNGSYSRNYKLEWLRDVPEGALLYASPADAAPVVPQMGFPMLKLMYPGNHRKPEVWMVDLDDQGTFRPFRNTGPMRIPDDWVEALNAGKTIPAKEQTK